MACGIIFYTARRLKVRCGISCRAHGCSTQQQQQQMFLNCADAVRAHITSTAVSAHEAAIPTHPSVGLPLHMPALPLPSLCFLQTLQVPLPETPPWNALFGSPLQQIYEVAATLHQLYRAQKPRFIPVCHQLLPSKPPTPALAAAQGEAAGEEGATPLLGRPGRPLDPSVRRVVGDVSTRAVGATPGQVGAGAGVGLGCDC